MGLLAGGTTAAPHPWQGWRAVDLLYIIPLVYIVYFFVRGVYRITLHPLAKFPGPKLAAWTRWSVDAFSLKSNCGMLCGLI
jgi:hypothetical protein